jgi:pyridoxine 5-phosphate synthase
VVEFHTGTYCEAPAGPARAGELARLRRAAELAHGLGIECHAGHGLSYATTRPVAAIPEVAELNIGHFLVGEAVFLGFGEAIRRMREVMDAGRRDLARPDRG